MEQRTKMNIQTAGERFMKLKDVQDLLGVSRTTVWRWIAEHGLKVVRVGDVTRIRESDLQAFLERHETGSGCAESPQLGARGVQSA
jgi:excisionase family DNA binding protein